MRIRAGTSGYQYAFWRGSFYREGCKQEAMLGEYASQLSTVEINNTFYRMPKRAVVERWGASVPEDFRFTLKASRRITHQARLKDCADPLSFLLQNAQLLGPKLGCILFQLPPYLRKDLARLRDFLALLPRGVRVSLEFRHESWFDDEVYALLGEHDAALCLSDEGEGEAAVPFVATASFGYLRLRREGYGEPELAALVERVRAQPWREAYAYVKHEEGGAALALMLDRLAAA